MNADGDDTLAKEEFSGEPIRVWKMPYCLFDLGGAHLSGALHGGMDFVLSELYKHPEA